MAGPEELGVIPRSTTITDEGRLMRNRVIWGAAVVVVLVALAFAFLALDRSTVVDGPAGSSFATTATGLAALHDTLDRADGQPTRLLQPLSAQMMQSLDSYLVSDVEFGQWSDLELSTLAGFVEQGGTVVVLGIPPRPIVDAFAIDLSWSGRTAGTLALENPLGDAASVVGSRFGTFDTAHDGERIAGTADADLVVRFAAGRGSVVFIADSSVAHNATIALADNVDLLGELVGERPVFDEYRHGYDDTPSVGLITAAPGNWTAALVLAAVVLVLALLSYGRRFGPVEPRVRTLSPDRAEYVDSVARSLRRRGGTLPTGSIRQALHRELRLAPTATLTEVADAARRKGVAVDELSKATRPGVEDAYALDHLLAAVRSRGNST
jgi:hypothetical protein